MNKFIKNVAWDFKLIARYNILTIAAIITTIYCVLLAFIDTSGANKLVVSLIFSDPVMYGYLFVAVMILFEKEKETLKAFAVTPRKTSQYIWARNAAFTTLALLCSSTMLIFAQPENINFFYFFLAVILSSSLFVFIGLASIARVNNFNQFMVAIPIVLFPTCLPFLNFWEITDSLLFYLIPTQACLILFEAGISAIDNWQIIYAITYLLIWNYLAYQIAHKWYFKYILNTNRHE